LNHLKLIRTQRKNQRSLFQPRLRIDLRPGVKKHFRPFNETNKRAIVKWSRENNSKTSSKTKKKPKNSSKNIPFVHIRLELNQCPHHIRIAFTRSKVQRAPKSRIKIKTLERGKKHRKDSDRHPAEVTIAESAIAKTPPQSPAMKVCGCVSRSEHS
jgi:hypothetical protein